MTRAATAEAYDLPILIAGAVTITGGLHPEDETLPNCRIATNGDRTVLSSRDRERRQFRVVDALRNPTATKMRNGVVEITGMSEQLTNEVGMAPSEAVVTWRVELKACASCG